jgi:hypothetical protein
MATTTGEQYSIYLQLVGRRLVEGATLSRQTGPICETAAEAWAALNHGMGDCRLRCVNGNLAELRGLWQAWLVGEKAGDDE